MKFEYWFKDADVLGDYISNINDGGYIEIKRVNLLIGSNNSGKSRFLRSLFLQNNSDIRIKDLFYKDKIIEKILQKIPTFRGEHQSEFSFESKTTKTNTSKMKEEVSSRLRAEVNWDVVSTPLRNSIPGANPYGNESRYFIEKSLRSLIVQQANQQISDFHAEAIKFVPEKNNDFLEIRKKYIPVLRGMRPLIENDDRDLYKRRTVNDYFKGVKDIEEKIITGEDFYDLLTERLLGAPADRELIYRYQKLLSKYFFDNLEITLIPKYKSDVVHIKIGDADQFPIFMLGDGLQQAITLTFDAFLHKDAKAIYHMEEPELHLHPGMLRQLMNFFLLETSHIYFFTTHSNHLLDMINESPHVGLLKFKKSSDKKFEISVCDRDRELLDILGVRPSSIYFANCSIWVEGVTDRLYLNKYMENYIKELNDFMLLSEGERKVIFEERNYQVIMGSKIRRNSNNYLIEITELVKRKYDACRRLMQNLHYTFVEYQGSNLIHWNFDSDFGGDAMKARSLTKGILLVADGDISDKRDRIAVVKNALAKKESMVLIPCKEIENTLPIELITKAASSRYEKMTRKIKNEFDMGKLKTLHKDYFFNEKNIGIGLMLDMQCWKANTKKRPQLFAANGVGTIDKKTDFCHEVLALMDSSSWELTKYSRELTSKIFDHIESNNK